jgi:hypothetical protein
VREHQRFRAAVAAGGEQFEPFGGCWVHRPTLCASVGCLGNSDCNFTRSVYS